MLWLSQTNLIWVFKFQEAVKFLPQTLQLKGLMYEHICELLHRQNAEVHITKT